MKQKRSFLLALLAAGGLASTGGAQTTPGGSPVDQRIPFAQVRSFLPADGVPFVVWRGTPNRWPKNANDGEFFTSEIGEIAFGRAIRAKEGDREKEYSLSPGITAKDGYIELKAGWRAHKEVPKHPDFFDGTISGKVYLGMQQGETTVSLQEVQFHWNPSAVAKVVDFVGTLRATLEREIAKVIQTKLEEALKKELETRPANIPNFDAIKSRVSLKIVEGALVVTIGG